MKQNPIMATALNDPVQFARIFDQMKRLAQQQGNRAQEQSFDPMDPEGQRRIEEEIRQRNIAANMENAMEHHPESFGRVSTIALVSNDIIPLRF